MTHLLQHRHGLHISDVRVGEDGYHVTAWRTTCLYGVTYSRASPRLPDDVPFSVPVQFAHLRCASGEGLSCHRMAHFVLIRCYLQSSLSEASRCRTFFSTGTVRTSPMCEWGGWLSCHRMAHFVLIRCYLQSSLSEASQCRTFFSTGHCLTGLTCPTGLTRPLSQLLLHIVIHFDFFSIWH